MADEIHGQRPLEVRTGIKKGCRRSINMLEMCEGEKEKATLQSRSLAFVRGLFFSPTAH